jgi:putative glutamine amidotransferase
MKRRVIRLLAAALATVLLSIAALFAAFYVPDPGNDAPRVLVSVDRTVWNGLGINRLTYIRKLRLAGLRPVLSRYPGAMGPAQDRLAGFDGLVLSGGGDVAAAAYGGDPDSTRNVSLERDAFELALLHIAEEQGLPILGLCRGAQLLNVYRGGTLGDFRDEPRFGIHRNALHGHSVRLESGSRLAAIFDTESLESVTSWHGQHVEQPGDGLRITAYSADGIAEAIEDETAPFIVGVQWHAETPPWDEQQERLFEAFADAVKRRR